MLKCLFAACLLINLVTNTQAQIDSLANCSFASRYFSLTDLFYAQIKDKDSTQAFQYIDKIRAEAQKNKDTELALHADYFKLWYYQDGRQPNRVQLPLLANKLLTEVKALKNKPLEVEIYLRLAYYHYQLEKNYAAAFTNYLLAYDLLKNLSVETYPNKSYTLQDIGLAYYAFEDYETALHFLLEAVNTKPAYAYSALQTLNNVGLTYFHLNQYDKAITYLTKCRNMAKGMGIYSWVGIADGNLGQVYQQLGKYEQALPLFQSDIDYAFIDKEYANAAMSQLRMADIHLRQANTNLAASNLDKAMKLLLKSGNYPTAYKHLSYLFRLRARILWLRGKTNEAFVAQDSSDYYQDILKSRLNKLQLTRGQYHHQPKRVGAFQRGHLCQLSFRYDWQCSPHRAG